MRQDKERARVAFLHALPKLDGNRLQATVVEVHYGPGEASSLHSHPFAVIGYVIGGTLRTQVKGEPEAIYRGGESFYEAPMVFTRSPPTPVKPNRRIHRVFRLRS